MESLTNTTELFVTMTLSNWDVQNKRFNNLLTKLTDEELMAETAPDRNSGIYLLGHLAAVSDGLLPLLGFGERLYPEMDAVFLKNPDKSGLEKPSVAELKTALTNINTEIDNHIAKMQTEEWFTKHSAVSTEDFAKEPHRNKLNLIANRTMHMAYHLGQMTYLVKK